MKDYSIKIRMSQIEKELISKKAKILNMNVSQYLRFIGINGTVKND